MSEIAMRSKKLKFGESSKISKNIFGIKQEMMQKLWNAEHPKDTETEKTDELER